MDNVKPFKWDFDRNPWDTRADAEKFSIGVYQWLPKADGKGLKKSKTLRVSGYVCDAEVAYAKAKEICDTLNREGVRFENLPSWVQKSYSVPKPLGYEPERTSNRLTGDEVRGVRVPLMKRVLIPLGFVQSHASTYNRRVGQVVQVVNFQTIGFGLRYIMNLGLHYTFTPPCQLQSKCSWKQVDLQDCVITHQFGPLVSFGEDKKILSERLKRSALESVEALDRHSDLLADPSGLLSNAWSALQPFYVGGGGLLETSIQIKKGMLEQAEQSLNQLLAPPAEVRGPWREHLKLLLQGIKSIRTAQREGKPIEEFLEWLTD